MIFKGIETSSRIFKKHVLLLLWCKVWSCLFVLHCKRVELIFEELKFERLIIAS